MNDDNPLGALLEMLAENRKEIRRLKDKLNGGISTELAIEIYADGGPADPLWLGRVEIRTAGDGIGLTASDGSEVIMNPADRNVLRITVYDL